MCDIKVTIESPFFRDELIRMLHDMGGMSADIEKVTDLEEMVYAINKQIVSQHDGIPSCFGHVYISVRVIAVNHFYFNPCDIKMHTTNMCSEETDAYEVVITSSIKDWIWYINTHNKKSSYPKYKKLAEEVKNWLLSELKGIKLKELLTK